MNNNTRTQSKEIDGDNINKQFEAAVHLVKSLPQKGSAQPSYSDAAKIYSLFKQSKFGRCNQQRPGFWDPVSRAKWDAWSSLGELSKEDAMKQYVNEIKKLYEKFQCTENFEENELEYAEIIIPFCQSTDSPLTPKLKQYLKEKEKNEKVDPEIIKENNEKQELDFTNESLDAGYGSNHCLNNTSQTLQGTDYKMNDPDTSLNEDEEGKVSEIDPSKGRCVYEKTEANLIHRQNDSYSSNDYDELYMKVASRKKNVEFKERNEEDEFLLQQNDIVVDYSSSGDEEIYCDSIDPDQITSITKAKVKENMTEQEVNDEKAPNKEITNFADTAIQTNDNRHGNLSSTETSKSDFEIVEKSTSFAHVNFEKGKLVKTYPPKKYNLPEDFHRTYYYKDHHKRHVKRHNRNQPPVDNNDTLKGGRRIHQNKNRVDKKPNNNHSSKEIELSPQQINDAVPSEKLVPCIRHSHSTNEDHSLSSSSDGEYSFESSSSETVGLKIVQALERMDENLNNVVDRMDSIEKNLKYIIKHSKKSFWPRFLPSKTTIFWFAWPVILNLFFYLLWRRQMRKRIRKC